MNKRFICLSVIAIIGVLLLSGCVEEKKETTEKPGEAIGEKNETTEKPGEAIGENEETTEKPDVKKDVTEDIEYLESIQLDPPEDYILELKSIIQNNPEPYVRERGIFALTDIAIRKNETEKIVDFLKEIAMDEKEDNVRTSAYASIDLIRDHHPLEKKGSLELSVSGDIRKGSSITLIAKVSSTIDTEEESMVGITSLHNNIELLSNDGIQKVYLRANEPQNIEFDLKLKETGNYFIPVTFVMSFDRIDYEKIKKEAYIVVNESNGEFFRLEEVGG